MASLASCSCITWHQWHQTASRSSNTKRWSRLASAKTASDHGRQFRWLSRSATFDVEVAAPDAPAATNKTNAVRKVLFTCPILKYGFAPRLDVGTAAKGHR